MALDKLTKLTSQSGITTTIDYQMSDLTVDTITVQSGGLKMPVGMSTFQNVTVTGDLTVQGTTTTLDTKVTEVDLLEVGANNTTVGVAITQSGTGDILNLYDGSTEVFSVADGGTVTSTKLVVAESIAVNRPRIVLSAPNDGTNFRHLFGANLEVNSSGTFTTPTANISGGGWQYLSANSINQHGEIRYISAPDTNATSSTPITRFVIDSDGKVGINESNPATTLELSAGTNKNLNVWSSGAYATGITIGSANDAFSAYTPIEFRGSGFYFHNGTAEKLRITSAGQVGIGTDNPTAESGFTKVLHVYGDSPQVLLERETASGAVKAGISAWSGNAALETFNATPLRVRTDGNLHQIYLKTDGKIGMGTDTIDGNLHVYNSTAGSVTAASDANELILESAANVGMTFLTANDSISRIKFGDTTATNRGIFFFNHDDQSFNFQHTSSNRLKIKSDGTVYTVTQGAKFGISQDPTLTTMGATSGTWQVPEVDGSTIGAEMRIGDHNTNSVALIRLASYGSSDDEGGGAIMFTNTRVGSALYHSDLAAIKGAREELGKGYLRFFTANRAANTEKMRITSTGLVGIGTDLTNGNSLARLCVYGKNATVWNNDLSTSYAHSPFDHELMVYNSQLNTTGSFASILLRGGCNSDSQHFNTARIAAIRTGNTYGCDLAMAVRDNSSGNLTERLRIKETGSVGIGTISPQYELHVWPDGATTSGQICAQSNGNNTFAELVLKTSVGGSANIWKNSTGKTDYGGANSLNIYNNADAPTVFFTNGNKEKVRIGGSNNTFRAQTLSYPETTETLAEFNGGVAEGNRFSNRYIKIKNTYTGSNQGGIPIVWEANANGSNQKSYGAIVTDANGDIRILSKPAGSAVAIGSGLGLSNRFQIYVGGNIRMGTDGTGYGGLSVQNSPSVNQPAIEAGANTATNGVFAFATRYVGANEDYYSTCISTNYSSGRSVFAHGARGSRNDTNEYGDFLAGNATSTNSTAFVSTFDNFSMNRKAITMNNSHMTLWRQSQGSGTGEADGTCTKGLEVKMLPGLTLTEDGRIGVGDQCEGTLDNTFHIRQSGDVTATLGSCPAGLVIEATTDANWADGEAGAELCFMKGNDINGAIRCEHDRAGGDHSYEDGGLAFYTAPAAETPTATRKLRLLSTGNATLTGTLTDGSDVRLKSEVVNINDALSKVNQMRGIEYKLSSAALDNCGMRDREDGLKTLGVIADEIESILPQVVQSNAIKGLDGTDYKGVSYSRIVPVLIEAIKELSAKVTALEGS